MVQHLSPDFRSLMDELIARHSEMPVVVAEDGMPVLPNRIHLMPPRKEMIVTALTLLRHRGQSSKELDIIARQVDHLVRLVDDLLDIARITRGKVELRRQAIELDATVAKAIEIATPLLEQRGHHLTVDVPRGLRVDGDPLRLAQVVANLLTNAAKYTPQGGRISAAGFELHLIKPVDYATLMAAVERPRR